MIDTGYPEKRGYCEAMDYMINTYVKMSNKENECIDLGSFEDDAQAKIKAIELMCKRYPYISKKVISANITVPDIEDFVIEYGEPTFIYKVDNRNEALLFIKSDIDCGTCSYYECNKCKLHNKNVKEHDFCCKNYKETYGYWYK